MSVDCMNVRPGVEVASLTDVGCQRENNEDSYLYWEPASDEEFQRKGRLAAIADGMGGHEGGQEASRLAVETVREVYDQALGDDPQAALVGSLTAAHTRIQNYAERYPAFQGMGTTCTALVLRGRQLYFAHVGDSRLYLVRGCAHLAADSRSLLRWPAGGERHRPRRRCGEASAAPHPHRRLRSGKGTGGRWRRPDVGLARGRRSPALHRRPLERRDRGRTGDRRQREPAGRVLRGAGEAGAATGRARQRHPASVARWS